MVKIYNPVTDELDEVTQDDIERLTLWVSFLGAQRELLRAISRRSDAVNSEVLVKERIKLMRQCAEILNS